MVKPGLQTCPTSRHNLCPQLVTEHSLRQGPTMKPCLQPCPNTESSQQHHLVRERSLRPHSTSSNGRAQSITLPNHRVQPVAPPCQGTQPGFHRLCLTKGNCRAQLMAPRNHGAQPATLPSQGAHSAALLKHGAPSTHPTTKPSYW